jgi:hypothetical protein
MMLVPSTDRGVSDGSFIEPCIACHTTAGQYLADPYQQADAFEAMFEAIDAMPPGDVVGLVSNGFNYHDDFHLAGGAQDMVMEKAESIRGKPAEEVCRYWFSRF